MEEEYGKGSLGQAVETREHTTREGTTTHDNYLGQVR